MRLMSALGEGIKILFKEALPVPGLPSLVEACDPGGSNVTHKEAAITQHVEDLKKSLEGLNGIDHTRQVEFKDKLDRLISDYRANHTNCTTWVSRLTKATEILEALDNLSEQITMSFQNYTIDSICDVEERMTKNEANMSSVFDMLKSLKELLHQAGESLASLRPPSLAQFWTGSNSSGDIEEDLVGCVYFTDNKHCIHPWGLAFHEYSRNGHGSDSIDFLANHFPECYNSAVRGGHYCPGDNIDHTSAPPEVLSALRCQIYDLPRGCTTPRSFDISSMFSHQASATQVIAECFRSMASSIRISPDMPIHAWSHSCEPMAST